MKNPKDVPLPELMRHLPKDGRGYPVPFNVLRDTAGTPHFAINDDVKTHICIEEKKCSICGHELHDDMWIIGGPKSAFHPNGVFVDVPVHKQCGEYALQVCPYLAIPTYSSKLSTEDKVSKVKGVPGMAYMNPTQSAERVAYFAFCKITGYQVIYSGIERYIKPHKPYLEIEIWDGGVCLVRGDDAAEEARIITSKLG